MQTMFDSARLFKSFGTLRQLKLIRNSVEHADRGAPSHSECLGLVDSVWYFLRSTDIFASKRAIMFDLEGPRLAVDRGQPGAFAEFTFEDRTWMPDIRGWFPLSSVTTSPHDEGIHITLREPIRRGNQDHVYLHGQVMKMSGPAEDLIREYFLIDLPDNSRQAL